jgi:hypothetical protein
VQVKPQGIRKSPLKDPPLRNPGQSLEEDVQRRFDDDWMPLFLASLVVVSFAVFEWWRYFYPASLNPWIPTSMAFLMVAFSLIRVVGLRPGIRNLRLGIDGEKTVGQSLEKLRANGAIVFHDIPAGKFNVDHIVISPKGIFVIETKTRSKPNGRMGTIKYDGETVLVDGIAPDRDPIQQVKSNSSWIQELIWESTGKSFPVRPVVLFPGWFVEPLNSTAQNKVWVLNPKSLSSFMQHEKVGLAPEDINLIAYHLSRYIRTKA